MDPELGDSEVMAEPDASVVGEAQAAANKDKVAKTEAIVFKALRRPRGLTRS